MLALAFRNIFRNRARTALTLTVIASGVAGLILCGGFVADALNQLREATIHSQLGHLQIYRDGFYEKGSRSPNDYLIDKPSDVLDVARKLPDFEEGMARLNFSAVINNGRSDFAVVGEGVEPEKEKKLGSLLEIVEGRGLETKDLNGIFIGEGVALATRLKVGDRATVLLHTVEGALNSGEFEVLGIFRSFSKDYDARAVRITLPAAQELMALSSVNAIVVLLKTTEATDRAAGALAQGLQGKGYEIKTWRQLADFYDKTASLYQRQFIVLEAIILMAVLLSVINAVNMSVYERTAEFGTLMALGTHGSGVSALVLQENLLLGLIGSALGALAGIVLALVISAIGIPMPPPPNSSTGYVAAIDVDALTVLTAFAIGCIATVAAAWFPSRRVAKLAVVDALRQA
ncbi:MAG: ABC transporter permease [Burkholderiaceae bacterium]